MGVLRYRVNHTQTLGSRFGEFGIGMVRLGFGSRGDGDDTEM